MRLYRLVLADFIAFVKRPTYAIREEIPLQNATPGKRLLSLFPVSVFLTGVAIAVVLPVRAELEELLGKDLKQHHDVDDWGTVLFLVTLVPLCEEIWSSFNCSACCITLSPTRQGFSG